jgi:hypothetical protein
VKYALIHCYGADTVQANGFLGFPDDFTMEKEKPFWHRNYSASGSSAKLSMLASSTSLSALSIEFHQGQA